MERFQLEDRVLLVHSREDCKSPYCVIHNPSEHPMRDWPLYWRNDRGIFERTCSHGVGHPDPDQLMPDHAFIHGCDGCCSGTRYIQICQDNAE